jgi:hypothetical protein
MTNFRGRIDHSVNPSVAVGRDERRACADRPTWWWFALPFVRTSTDDDPRFDDAFAGGNDTEARRAGHQQALNICAHCPLALKCLQASWRTEEYGTYGAVSEVERFYLGGRGRSTSQPRSVEKYEKALAKIAKRYGSPQHPVVRWIEAQGLPYGVKRPERVDGAA